MFDSFIDALQKWNYLRKDEIPIWQPITLKAVYL